MRQRWSSGASSAAAITSGLCLGGFAANNALRAPPFRRGWAILRDEIGRIDIGTA